MADERFPILLELYRCDLESTYRGPDGYYRACKIYRDYLKNEANPFRSADGKKLVRLFVD
jgi:poly(A) polymerase